MSEHACDTLDIAECVLALVRAADPKHVMRLYAVFPPTVNGKPVMTTDLMHDAFVCVDSMTASLLLRSWDWAYSTTSGPLRTTPLRCMSWDRYQRLRKEYEAWRASIVQENVKMAKKSAERMRSLNKVQQIKHSEKMGGLSPNSATLGQKRLAVSNHVDYPLHTIVALRISPDAAPSPNTLKAHFAAMSVNAIDYVDVRPELSVAYIRCAASSVASMLVEKLGAQSSILYGEAQAAYWAQVPQRVRNAASKRSLKYTCAG